MVNFSAAALKLCRFFVPLFTPTANFHRKLTVAHVTLFCMPLFALQKELDGCFTRLLRADLNISLRDHISNKELYRDLPPISTSLQIHRLKFVAHCWRSKNETVSKLLLWDPKRGSLSRERPATIFIDQLESDTGLLRQDLASVMANRREWGRLKKSLRVRPK